MRAARPEVKGMVDLNQADALIGREVRTLDGDRIGTITAVYQEDGQGQPEWVAVDAGAPAHPLVPLLQAHPARHGVAVPYSRHQIASCPGITGRAEVPEDEERSLYEHYQLSYAGDATVDDRREDAPADGLTGRQMTARLRRWTPEPPAAVSADPGRTAHPPAPARTDPAQTAEPAQPAGPREPAGTRGRPARVDEPAS